MNIKNYIKLFLFIVFCCQFVEANHTSTTSIANQSWQKGNIAFQQYEYDTSLTHLNRALTIFEEQKQWNEYVLVLCKIAENLDKLERFGEMKQAAQQAVEVACKHLKEEDKALGQAYHLLGESLWVDAVFQDWTLEEKNNMLRDAIYHFEIAENIFQFGEYWENLVENHINMGFIRVHLRDDLKKAENYMQETIRTAKDKFADKDSLRNLIISKAYGVLEMINRRFIGDFDKTLEYSNLSLKYRLQLPNKWEKDKLFLALKYTRIGQAHGHKRDREQSFLYLYKAKDLLASLKSSKVKYEVYHTIAYTYMYFEDYDNAIKYGIMAHEIAKNEDFTPKKQQPEVKIEAYWFLAATYFRMEKGDSAAYWMNKGIQYKKHIPQHSETTFLGVVLEQAVYQKKNNQLDAALHTLTPCIENIINRKINESSSWIYNLIGEIHIEKGDYKKALESFQKSLYSALLDKQVRSNLYENPPIDEALFKPYFLHTLQLKAKTLRDYYFSENQDQKILEASFRTYKSAINGIETVRREYTADASKKTLGENTLTIYEEAIEVCLLLYELTQDVFYQKQAYLFNEKSKASLLIEAISEGEIKANYLPDSLLQVEKRFKMNLAFYENLVYEENQKDKQDTLKMTVWMEKIFQLKREKELFLHYLKKEHTHYFELKYASKIADEEAVKKMLSQSQALIEFFWGEESLYAFVILPDEKEADGGMKTYKIGEVAKLKSEVLQLIQDHQNPNSSFNDYISKSYTLYQKLLEPIVSDLNQNTRDLIIIPDGMLGYLPFEALITELPENKTEPNYSIHNLAYLIENFQISYNYSASLSLQHENRFDSLKNPVEEEKTLLAYAPSFYGEYDGLLVRSCADTLAELQCAKEEVLNLKSKWNGKGLTDEEATKQHFLAEATSSHILHLATHACMDDQNPNFNRIYFSNEEYLTALELYALDLETELTVLSACNTGNGQLLKGEGIMSLARGFMAAGCPSLVTTLWGVNDCTTKSLMSSFYEHLYNGEQKDEALRSAKLAYLNDSDATRLTSHPFYWAAFVQLGDSQAMFKKENTNSLFGIYVWSIGMFLLVLGVGILKRRVF